MYVKSLAQRKFLSLLLASSLELVMIVVVFISDTIIAGHAVGENGLSAMSIIGPIVFIIFLMGCLNSFGLSFCYNSAMGNADKKRADELLGTGIIASLASGLILFVIMTLYEEQYFALMKPAPEVVNYAHEYYSFYRFLILIDPFGSLLGIMVYNDGDELLSDIANITRVAGNIVFSLFFAFVLKMGIAGVALGTIVESLTATIILLFHFFRKTNSLKPKIYFSFRDLFNFLRLGFVDSGNYLTSCLLVLVINKFIIVNFDSKFLAVVMIVTNILEFSVILNGPAQAMQPLVSVYYNEDNYSAVRKVINISVKISLIEGFILSTVLFIFADYVPAIFGIYEPETVKACVSAVRIVSSTFTILSILYLFETYYVILGKNTIAVISLFARSLIFIIMLAIPLGLAWNINGIWVGFAAAPLLTLIFCSILLYRIYGRKKFPLYLEKKNITADFDVMLTSENVMKLRDDVEKLLTVSSVPSDVINKVMLLIEETGMMIIEFNKGVKFLLNIQ